MTNGDLLPPAVLKRKAVVYVRQSSQAQVQTNLESQHRQYELVDVARRRGFRDVEVIDDDLGRSASGMVARPGFERLAAWLCAGEVGAVLCYDASRLARNSRDWHHLLELCGLVGARVIDLDGVYDPCRPNDRLLLGMKGSFARFRELGSARQVLLSLAADKLHFPRPSDSKRMTAFDWTPIRYRNVISVLKNPFYAGAYIYGKSEHRTEIVNGRAQKTYGYGKPFEEWDVVLKDHHEGYIEWGEFERNQKQLAANAYGRVGDAKSGRGGQALLVGVLGCARCGRRLKVAYRGRSARVYRCDSPNLMLGAARCLTFGSSRVDPAVARELLRAVEPIAVDAATEAERLRMERVNERRHILELDLQKARYEASLAERRYAACDPDNRLIAAQLEKNWETALRRVEACQARLEPATHEMTQSAGADFVALAKDLETAWASPNVSMRSRQQLLRTLVVDIIADIDEAARDVILTIHWRGGQHSQLRVRKPKTGEHGCQT